MCGPAAKSFNDPKNCMSPSPTKFTRSRPETLSENKGLCAIAFMSMLCNTGTRMQRDGLCFRNRSITRRGPFLSQHIMRMLFCIPNRTAGALNSRGSFPVTMLRSPRWVPHMRVSVIDAACMCKIWLSARHALMKRTDCENVDVLSQKSPSGRGRSWTDGVSTETDELCTTSARTKMGTEDKMLSKNCSGCAIMDVDA